MSTTRKESQRSRQPFHYQRRTPEQWRAKAREGIPEGSELIGADADQLASTLAAAAKGDHLLSAWQSVFCDDLRERLERWGPRLYLSERQWFAIEQIERRLAQRGLL